MIATVLDAWRLDGWDPEDVRTWVIIIIAIASVLGSLIKKTRGPAEGKQPGGTPPPSPPPAPPTRVPERPPIRRSPRPLPVPGPAEMRPELRFPTPRPAPLPPGPAPGPPLEPVPRARTVEPERPRFEPLPARPAPDITLPAPLTDAPERAMRVTPAIADIRPIPSVTDQPLEPRRRRVQPVPASRGHSPAAAGDWARLLREPAGLRSAFILSEVLGSPPALRPREEV